MSEPTYRVELEYDSVTKFFQNRWRAKVYRVADDESVLMEFGATMEEAFDAAQMRVKMMSLPQPDGTTVLLSEDGDILDPHEVQR